MLILAIDTSAVASAALVSDDALEGVVASFATEDTRSHAEVLAPGIEDMFASAGVTGQDIDALVVGVGPGPFTGLRSGIATARTLAFVWGKPLHGLMSLDAVALEVAESTAAVPEFLVATDARRKEVYLARSAWPRDSCQSLRTARTSASPRTCRTCRPSGQGPDCTRTFSAPTPILPRSSPTPCTWASSPWPGWPQETDSRIPRRCTCANLMPRSLVPGNGRCDRRAGTRHGRRRHPGHDPVRCSRRQRP